MAHLKYVNQKRSNEYTQSRKQVNLFCHI
uniref:Uncharacterized protein n=1 Tax=Anguilla anguilla TaxID=7936 RepID=A0A0E9UGL5_ANGAN